MRDHPRDAVPPGKGAEGDAVPPASPTPPNPPADQPCPEHWTGRATNRYQWALAALGAACLALGIDLAVEAAWWGGLAPLVMSVVGCLAAGLLILFGTLAFVKVKVKVDDDALEVRCGHAGLPRRRIPLRDVIEADHAPTVTPRHWGGWGYRWRPEKGTAVIVRRGEGLVLRLGDGRVFTVTVDDAEAAVRVIRSRLTVPGA
ncbi:lipoprotein [Streptomyces albiaxialis]|uniref:Lipoprotein n=1 Tax=Streptomyces albiaxialis TaxID=329523 RepID=A0ABN2VLQ5_9ACTN